MKLPEALRVGPLIWKVKNNVDEELDDNENFGETSGKHDTIKVGRNLSESRQRATLLHELFHAVEYTYLTPKLYLTEAQVKTMASGLLTVFLDNPVLKDILFPEVREKP